MAHVCEAEVNLYEFYDVRNDQKREKCNRISTLLLAQAGLVSSSEIHEIADEHGGLSFEAPKMLRN